MMDDIDFMIDVETDVISGEGRIATAGGIATLLTLNKCKWQLKVVYPPYVGSSRGVISEC
ncbi:hypothetical protein DOS80_06565 [Staphylococcus felis]|nr:hypothetical protein DOS60_05480 [Staphylococcus felis]REH93602.1 hypothetical protein DOS67_10900 [Staphylococcus felis]REI05441.1 hypothetical protein DOS62_03075 [Staphylococcus felis]REI30989.1 hypothetical protein DOS80_06565 [Staphylococcus felis]